MEIIKYKGKLGTIVDDYENKEIKRFYPVKYGRYYSCDLEIIDNSLVQETTHEEKLEYIRQDYVWGEVVKIHCISDYQIIESIDKQDKNTMYSCYVNYNSISTSSDTLDNAIIICMAKKYDGNNSQAAYYFSKMIGMVK